MGVKMSKYCKTTTVNHALAKKYKCCLKLINEIVKAESYHGEEKRCDFELIDFKDAKALDFDCVTSKTTPHPPSVDMLIGLDNRKILAVELKLNATKTPPFRSKKLTDKSISTQKLINADIQDFIVLFCHTRQALKGKIENYLRRISKATPPAHGYKMIFLEDFKKEYF